ncbi:MAG: guanylate kinase [Planctomycetes bacterium]|nr:guanylate kinase [Planctomycetota bacterium]
MSEFPVYKTHPKLFVLSGPSGAGKSTLLRQILEREQDCIASISATTRDPRGAEQDQIDYYFLSTDEFQRMITDNRLLEYAQVFGKHYYGTPLDFIEKQFANGKHVLMDIDVQGAMQIRERMPDAAILVFVTPPNNKELQRRLRGRGTDTEESIQARLEEAERELARAEEYDYLVINDSVEEAVEKLQHIIASERMKG